METIEIIKTDQNVNKEDSMILFQGVGNQSSESCIANKLAVAYWPHPQTGSGLVTYINQRTKLVAINLIK